MSVEPLSEKEIAAIREWHVKRPYRRECMQGDPWPCRNARWLATLDAVRYDASAPRQVAAYYRDWNDRLEAEHPIR